MRDKSKGVDGKKRRKKKPPELKEPKSVIVDIPCRRAGRRFARLSCGLRAGCSARETHPRALFPRLITDASDRASGRGSRPPHSSIGRTPPPVRYGPPLLLMAMMFAASTDLGSLPQLQPRRWLPS